MSIEFKRITKDNIAGALNVYNWYVLNSTATFHLDEIPQKELERMISMGHSKYESFIIVCDNEISGFCYLSQFRYKEAYDASAEITLYLNQKSIGKGIGKETLKFLENRAKTNGINNLVAVITEGNIASIKLFEKENYFKVSHLKKIGVKFGEALDVVSYQKII